MAPNPIEAILYYLESRCLSGYDLEPMIGSEEEVAKILNRKQALTLEMIRDLAHQNGVVKPFVMPVSALLGNVCRSKTGLP